MSMTARKSPAPKVWFTPQEVMQELQLHENTIWRYLAHRRIHAIKFGRLWRVPVDEVNRVKREGVPALAAV